MAKKIMTAPQRASMLRAVRAYPSAIRAQDAGERVTLASLYHRGLLERDAWRGVAGEADAAYEYRIGAELYEAVIAKRVAAVRTGQA